MPYACWLTVQVLVIICVRWWLRNGELIIVAYKFVFYGIFVSPVLPAQLATESLVGALCTRRGAATTAQPPTRPYRVAPRLASSGTLVALNSTMLITTISSASRPCVQFLRANSIHSFVLSCPPAFWRQASTKFMVWRERTPRATCSSSSSFLVTLRRCA